MVQAPYALHECAMRCNVLRAVIIARAIKWCEVGWMSALTRSRLSLLVLVISPLPSFGGQLFLLGSQLISTEPFLMLLLISCLPTLIFQLPV